MDDGRRAFKLSPDIEGELAGATVAHGPNAKLFDIKAALDAGDGVIVTNDPHLIDALQGHDAVVETDVPVGVAPIVLEEQAPSSPPERPVQETADIPAEHADVVDEETAGAQPAAEQSSSARSSTRSK